MAKFEPAKLKNLKILHEKQISCVKTDSPWRIFDALVAVILRSDSSAARAEADELGALYDANLDACYEFEIGSDKIFLKKPLKKNFKR